MRAGIDPKHKTFIKRSRFGRQELIFGAPCKKFQGESKSEVKTRGLLSKIYVYDGFMILYPPIDPPIDPL